MVDLSVQVGNLEVASRGEAVRVALLDLLNSLNASMDVPADRLRLAVFIDAMQEGYLSPYGDLYETNFSSSTNAIQSAVIRYAVGTIEWFGFDHQTWLPDFVPKEVPKNA